MKKIRPEDPEDQVTVTRDRTGKTISVTGSFCGGGIRPVKLIGTDREWKSLEARAKGTVPYSVIEKLLHRSKRTPQAVKIILRKYAEDVREEFSEDVYRFSRAANVKNPVK